MKRLLMAVCIAACTAAPVLADEEAQKIPALECRLPACLIVRADVLNERLASLEHERDAARDELEKMRKIKGCAKVDVLTRR